MPKDVDAEACRPANADESSIRWAVKYRLLALWLSCGLCAFLLIDSWSRPSLVATVVGVSIAYAGLALRAWALLYMESRSGTAVLDGGPFRFVRHPRYLGSLTILVGFLIAVGRSSYLAATLAFGSSFVFHFLTARDETKRLLRRYPEEATRYVSMVPAGIPNLQYTVPKHADQIKWPNITAKFLRRHMWILVGLAVALAALAVRAILVG